MSALVLLLFSCFAFAFDLEPEFQGLSESERDRLESPADIDGEYQSGVNAYTMPIAWNWSFAEAGRTYQTSVGSLTNQLFLINSRAKFEARLNESLLFRFTYVAQRDREIDQTRHILELSQRVLPWLSINAYGEPAAYKRDTDLGFAVVVDPVDNWTNRFYLTFFDLTRGGHNDQPDRFVDRDPLTYGYTGLWSEGDARIRAGFRIDRAVKWENPQYGYLFSYEKNVAFLDVQKASYGLRFQTDMTFKGRSNSESWRRERVLIRPFYLLDSFDTEIGFMIALRKWTNSSGANVFHQSLLPSVTTRFAVGERNHVQLALEATDFHTFGDLSLVPSSQRHESTEGRLQTAYEFGFNNDAKLLIAANFDLDEWITTPTFEGGNAQFTVAF